MGSKIRKKIILAFCITCCIFTVLCACGQKASTQENGVGEKRGQSDNETSEPAENGTGEEQEYGRDKEGREESAPVQDEEEPAARDYSGIEDWKLAYLVYLDEREDAACCTYTFIYVDDDDIPELVIDSGYEAGGCQILTWHDGVLDELQTWRLEFSYIEKENLLCNSSGISEYYYDRFFSITDKKWEYVAGGEWGNGEDGVQFDENGNFIFVYSWNGEIVGEAEYRARLNAVYPKEKAADPSCEAKYYILSEICSILITGENASAGHRYELILEDVAWKDADELCKEKGGYLATITSWEELERIQAQIIAEEKEDISFWVGANNESNHGFCWLEPGTENGYNMAELFDALFHFWSMGEPSYRGFTEDGVKVEEDYVILFYQREAGRCYISDVPNDILAASPSYEGKIGYICEYDE